MPDDQKEMPVFLLGKEPNGTPMLVMVMTEKVMEAMRAGGRMSMPLSPHGVPLTVKVYYAKDRDEAAEILIGITQDAGENLNDRTEDRAGSLSKGKTIQ